MIKILKKAFMSILCDNDWSALLYQGKFLEFEELLFTRLLSLYDLIAESFILSVSGREDFQEERRVRAERDGLGKLELRSTTVQLRTGTKVRLPSLYAKKVPQGYQGGRHLCHSYWGVFQGAGPMYASITCLLSVICPSFAVGRSLMCRMGIKGGLSRVREVSLTLAGRCMERRDSVQLDSGESLTGKRVVIAMDGGRTRTRSYTDEFTRSGNRKFHTGWREPKMFVITTIDENGEQEKDTLPVYDATFGDDEMIELLSRYLKNLKVDQADHVQVVADGAPWIWNRVKPMLMAIGVEKDKIIETLDYYHASEHLHRLREYLPEKGRDHIFNKMKDHLWKGNITSLGRLLVRAIPGLELKEFTPFQYFVRNEHRIDYQWLRFHAWSCGSGIIESGIRRIINLRFKSPSSFWYPENAEKLILMRAIALSGRWDIMLKNMFMKNHV